MNIASNPSIHSSHFVAMFGPSLSLKAGYDGSVVDMVGIQLVATGLKPGADAELVTVVDEVTAVDTVLGCCAGTGLVDVEAVMVVVDTRLVVSIGSAEVTVVDDMLEDLVIL